MIGVDVLGVRITPISVEEILTLIENWIKTGQRKYISVCPNYSIMNSHKDVQFRNILNGSALAVADGVSVVWACKVQGYKKAKQVRGTDLMLQVCSMAAEKGYSNFFYGGAEGVPEKLSENLKQRFPGLKIAGIYSPPFSPLTEQESKDVLDMINAANPDILWVGLGAPKQELWMAHYINYLNVPVMIGVGAAFDFLSGNKQEAPKWVQRAALEWLFRLIKEPKRLWKRNLYHPIFIGKLIIQKWLR